MQSGQTSTVRRPVRVYSGGKASIDILVIIISVCMMVIIIESAKFTKGHLVIKCSQS